MELQLVNFVQAKALKKLNFPIGDYLEEMVPVYTESGKFVYSDGLDQEDYFAPTLELVSKWLREEKNIHICPIYYSSKTYKTEWYSCEVNQHQINNDEEYSTYEGALIAGIDKAIEILKNNEKNTQTSMQIIERIQ